MEGGRRELQRGCGEERVGRGMGEGERGIGGEMGAGRERKSTMEACITVKINASSRNTGEPHFGLRKANNDGVAILVLKVTVNGDNP